MLFWIILAYIVIGILIYFVAVFIDGRKLGKGEITQEKADSERDGNVMIAALWPLIVAFFIVASPFVLVYYIGNGIRKLGEYTTTRRNISSGDTNC